MNARELVFRHIVGALENDPLTADAMAEAAGEEVSDRTQKTAQAFYDKYVERLQKRLATFEARATARASKAKGTKTKKTAGSKKAAAKTKKTGTKKTKTKRTATKKAA